MKLAKQHILKPKEIISLISALVLAGLIYAAMIHPSMRLFSDLDKARLAKEKASKELDQIRQQQHELENSIIEQKKRLASLGGSPPTDKEKDALMARLTKLAEEECQITIDRCAPMDTLIEDDHRAFFMEFTGRGSFSALKQYFRRMEKEIDFVDVTHFSITVKRPDISPECMFAWSCRINGMRVDTIPSDQLAGPIDNSFARLEVAADEP